MTPKIKLIIANPAIYPPASKGSEPRHLINTSCLSWRTSFRVDAAILAQEQGFPPGPRHRQAPRTASLKPKGIACYQVSRCLSYILHTPPHSHAHASQASDSIKWTVYMCVYNITHIIYIKENRKSLSEWKGPQMRHHFLQQTLQRVYIPSFSISKPLILAFISNSFGCAARI